MTELFINKYIGQPAETSSGPNFKSQTDQKMGRKALVSSFMNTYKLIMPQINNGEPIEGLLNDE